MKRWVLNILMRLLEVLEMETVEWVFDEDRHPTLAAIETCYFAYINAQMCTIQDKLDKEV